MKFAIIALVVGLSFSAGAATATLWTSRPPPERATKDIEIAQVLSAESVNIACTAQDDAMMLRSKAALYDSMANNIATVMAGKPLEEQHAYASLLGFYRGAAEGSRKAAKERDEMAQMAGKTVTQLSASTKD